MIDHSVLIYTAIAQVAETGRAVGELAEIAVVRDVAGFTHDQTLELTRDIVRVFDFSARAAAKVWVPIFHSAVEDHIRIVNDLKERQGDSTERPERPFTAFCSRDVKW